MFYKERLKSLRLEKNLTQKDTAEILNIYKGLYNQYETEYEIIPIKHLITLCDYFNVSIDYIFNFTNTPNYKDSQNGCDKVISGKRIQDFRKENKLTQKYLATKINTDNSNLSKYERGIRTIATPYLYDICKKYQVSADYLLGKTDNPKYLK